jgi:hypothetical protein
MDLQSADAAVPGFHGGQSRWERFTVRSDDVIISTPSKCGTTWMQMIVGMLLLDRTDLGGPPPR